MPQVTQSFLSSIFLHIIIIIILIFNLNTIKEKKNLDYKTFKVSFSNYPPQNEKEIIKKKISKKGILDKNKINDFSKKKIIPKEENIEIANKKNQNPLLIRKPDKKDKKKTKLDVQAKKDLKETLSSDIKEYTDQDKDSSDSETSENSDEKLNQEEKSLVYKKNKFIEKQTSTNEINKELDKEFESFKERLRYLIQKEAIRNYPRKAIRKREEGIVELIFSLNEDGVIKKVDIGSQTDATSNLIKSSLITIKNLSPFKKDAILKKRRNFSIKILYKIN